MNVPVVYDATHSVQLPGGKAMAIADLLNGKPGYFRSGMQFDASH